MTNLIEQAKAMAERLENFSAGPAARLTGVSIGTETFSFVEYAALIRQLIAQIERTS